MTETVRDNPAQHRFELDIDGHLAIVTYRAIDGGLALDHTETPPALRGRGAASRLAQGTLEAIRARGQKVRLGCSFLVDYVQRHPEFNDLVM